MVKGTEMTCARAARTGISLVLLGALAAALLTGVPERVGAAKGTQRVFEGPVAEADCGPGSRPETGLQGQVPLADRESGRSQEGYRCNMKLVGQYQGAGASWQMAWHDSCAYYDTFSYSGEGVAVLDVSKRKAPELTEKLTTPAMLGAWESLKVHEGRGLLAGVAAWSPAGNGPVFFDVYDVNDDCAAPGLKASVPVNIPLGHEGNWAQDGKTYYGSMSQFIAAIDVTDPEAPQYLTTMRYGVHGLATNPEGTRLYLSSSRNGCGNGMSIVDVSEIQERRPNPTTRLISEVCWIDGGTGQHPIPVTIRGRPYIIHVDEGGSEGTGPCCAGAARLIDIRDETKPRVVSKFKLEIHMPRHRDEAYADAANNGLFGYQLHYCNVDRLVEPTVLGCGAFQSGVRVIDIRKPMKPKEIAYFNPPAQVGKQTQLIGSEHVANPLNAYSADLTADWCTAQVRFVPKRRELWTTCQDNGFLVLRFTNGVWPFDKHRKQAGPRSSSG